MVRRALIVKSRGAPITPPVVTPSGRKVGSVLEPWKLVNLGGMTSWADPDQSGTFDGGRYRSSGGFHRDIPLNGPPSGEFRQIDHNQEVANAIAAGIDYFWCDITTPKDGNTNYERIKKQIIASNGQPFNQVPMLDMNGAAFGGTDTSSYMTPEVVADKLKADFFDTHANLIDGVYWITSFKAEGDSSGNIAGIPYITYWSRLLARLRSQVTDHPIKLQACLLYQTTARFQAFAAVADMMSIWGPAKPGAGVTGLSTWANLAHSLGMLWSAPVRTQDARNYSSIYAEAENTTLVRAMWAQAMSDNAAHVNVVTWNDYAESTQINPSRNHGYAMSWLTKYYTDWFRNGVQPAITDAKIILTCRKHSTGVAPTMSGITPVTCTLDGGGTHPYNKTGALVFLPSPMELIINGVTQGTIAAGITEKLVNLALDQVQTASLKTGSTTVKSVSSTITPHDPPYVPDYDYRWAISP